MPNLRARKRQTAAPPTNNNVNNKKAKNNVAQTKKHAQYTSLGTGLPIAEEDPGSSVVSPAEVLESPATAKENGQEGKENGEDDKDHDDDNLSSKSGGSSTISSTDNDEDKQVTTYVVDTSIVNLDADKNNDKDDNAGNNNNNDNMNNETGQGTGIAGDNSTIAGLNNKNNINNSTGNNDSSSSNNNNTNNGKDNGENGGSGDHNNGNFTSDGTVWTTSDQSVVSSVLEMATDKQLAAMDTNNILDTPMPSLGDVFAANQQRASKLVAASSVTVGSEAPTVQKWYAKLGEWNACPVTMRATASRYVREVGFAQLKFIDTDTLLLLDGPISNSVLKFLDQPKYRVPPAGGRLSEKDKEKNQEVFKKRTFVWNGIKDYIRKALNTCRGNRCAEMQSKFKKFQDAPPDEATVAMPNGVELRRVVQEMRSDTTGTYKLIMQVFGPAVVTVKKMTNGLMTDRRWSSIVSVSDEAFILLYILNSWNTWVTGDLKIPSSDNNWPQDKPVWSTEGQGNTAKKYRGWAESGLKYYATLFAAVQQDRSDEERNSEFDQEMEKCMKDSLSATNLKKLNQQIDQRTGTTNAPNDAAPSAMSSTIMNME